MKKHLILIAAILICGTATARQNNGAKKAHWGIEAGYDHSWLRATSITEEDKKKFDSDSEKCTLNGFHIGPTMVYDFLVGYRHIPSISVGVYYQFLASDYPMGFDRSDYKKYIKEGKKLLEDAGGKNPYVADALYSHAIQIPVNARYTFRPNDKFNLFVHTGPMINIYAARYNKVSAYANVDGKRTGVETYQDLLSNKTKETTWTLGKKSVKESTVADTDRASRICTLYWDLGIGITLNRVLSISLSYESCLSNQSFVTKVGNTYLNLRDDVLKVNLGISF